MSDPARDTARTVPATRVDTSILDNMVAGAYGFEATNKGLFYICPCGCGEPGYLPFRQDPLFHHGQPDARPSWIFDGNRESPSLQPSIRRRGGCYYHGYLQNGIWTFQGDSGVKP